MRGINLCWTAQDGGEEGLQYRSKKPDLLGEDLCMESKTEEICRIAEAVEGEEDRSVVLKICRIKLDELERKRDDMCKVKEKCELNIKEKKLQIAELKEDCERKLNEFEQWKKFRELKEVDMKNAERSYRNVMSEMAASVRMIQSKGMERMGAGGSVSMIQITLLGGKDLLICGRDGTSDPYCTMGVVEAVHQSVLMKAVNSMTDFFATKSSISTLNCQHSTTAHGTTAPQWNERFELLVTTSEPFVVAFEVWDDSDHSSVKLRDMKMSDDGKGASYNGEGDDFLGRAFLPSSMIKSELSEWVLPLYSRDRRTTYGEIRLCITLITV